jgi:hypothetical protein
VKESGDRRLEGDSVLCFVADIKQVIKDGYGRGGSEGIAERGVFRFVCSRGLRFFLLELLLPDVSALEVVVVILAERMDGAGILRRDC